MAPPRLDWTISLGNVITIMGGVVAIVMAYAALDGAVAGLQERFAHYERGAQDREARIRALELGASRTDERLVNIMAALERIERRLSGEDAP